MDRQLKGNCFSALAAIIYGLIPVFSLGIYGNGGKGNKIRAKK